MFPKCLSPTGTLSGSSFVTCSLPSILLCPEATFPSALYQYNPSSSAQAGRQVIFASDGPTANCSTLSQPWSLAQRLLFRSVPRRATTAPYPAPPSSPSSWALPIPEERQRKCRLPGLSGPPREHAQDNHRDRGHWHLLHRAGLIGRYIPSSPEVQNWHL